MKYLNVAVLVLLFCPVVASAVEDYVAKVHSLIQSIRASECTFVRNNKEHSAEDAAQHLEMKFNRAKRRIKSAEQFIEKVASKSSLSGKPYLVRCPNMEDTQAARWFAGQL